MIFIYRLLLILCLVCIAGCQDKGTPKGVVAVVNGEPVSLRAVQALMDTRQVSVNSTPRSSVKEMRENYAHATASMVIGALVRQELEERGLGVSQEELDQTIAQIRDELGADNFDLYLSDAALREDEWRLLMRDHLAMDRFVKKVIMPSIQIPLDEIRAYYEAHKPDFSKPELYNVCYGAAPDKESIQEWCKSGDAKEFAAASFAHCFNVAPEEMPQPWREDVKKWKPLICGKLVEQDGQWRSVALVGRQEAENLKLSAVYPLIENVLYEEKKNEAFNEWLAKKLEASRISASPNLFPKSDF